MKLDEIIRDLQERANGAGMDQYMTLRCDVAREIVAMLKEQEAVEPIGGYGFYICGVCKNPLNSASQKFCSECGKAVKWDD